MKNMALWAFIFTSSEALAAGGPTGIGAVSIGMSKQEYISAIGITTIDCNTSKKFKGNGGEVIREELKYLSPDSKTLCHDFRMSKKTGTVANIQIGDLSYDVIEANNESSKFVESIGHSSKAIFIKDRLISIEIIFPKVDLDTLSAKYGSPKLLDKTEVEICKNMIGNEFNNQVGTTEAVWDNGEVNAILRLKLTPPRDTCTDGLTGRYYIIEERRQLELIEAAINNFRKQIANTSVKDSPY